LTINASRFDTHISNGCESQHNDQNNECDLHSWILLATDLLLVGTGGEMMWFMGNPGAFIAIIATQT
jgi:hypothetical protein